MAGALLSSRIQPILLKPEVTYGVDPVPTGAADYILASNFSITPYNATLVDRNLDTASLGSSLQTHVGATVTCSFDVEITGSGGAVDAIPPWSPVLRCAGFSASVNSGVSVVHAPVSTGFESCTIYAYKDSVRHTITGAFGTPSFSLSPLGIPRFSFTFQGLYNAPIDQAVPALTDNSVIPIPLETDSVTTFTVGGYAAETLNFGVDMAGSINYYNMFNAECMAYTDRDPTGSIDVTMKPLADKDWFGLIASNTPQAIVMQWGSGAGNVVNISCPAAQLVSPQYGDNQSALTIQAGLRVTPTAAGNDELVITTT